MERKLYHILIILMVIAVMVGCADKEKKEKIDLQQIKNDRQGLDYRTDHTKDLFARLDKLLKRWHVAQKSRAHATALHTEGELEEQSKGHFSQLIDALDGENSYIAAAALGFSTDIRAIPYLNGALKTGDDATRSNAAMALGNIGSDQTPMDNLFFALKNDAQGSVRAMCAFAISQIVSKDEDQGALPHLLHALNDKSIAVRNNSILALEKIANEEGAKAIAAITMNDPNSIVRYNSIRVLGSTGYADQFVNLLIRKLRDSSPEVKNAAYQVLKRATKKDFGRDPAKWENWANLPPLSTSPEKVVQK